MPGISAPGFGESSGDPSEIPTDKPTTYPYPVSIIKPAILPSEIPTKDLSHMTKELEISKQRNMLMEYPIGYKTGAPSTISSYKLS